MAQTSTPPKRPASVRPGAAKSAPAHASPAAKPAAAPALMTDDEKTIYALGLTIYRSLGQFSLSPAEMEIVMRGLHDAAAGKPAEDLAAWGPKIGPLAKSRQKTASEAVLTKAAAEPGAIKTDSGLIYRDLTPGGGASPTASDTVKVNYRGTLPDGSEFDSSYKRNEPAQFPLSGVIRCWTEGVQKMKVGGKAQLVCPANLAYGEEGRPGIPGGATLTFEVELLDIVPAPAAAAEQTQPAEPAQPGQAAQPSQPAQTGQPSQAGQSAAPAKPSQPAQPQKPQ